MAAKKPNVFHTARPISYTGNSLRTQRRKRAEQKIAVQGTKLLTSFFKNQDQDSVLLEHYDNDSENQTADLDFESILLDLKTLLNDKTLSIQSRNQLQLIFQFINLRTIGYKTMNASQIVAESIGKEKYQAELIRVWTKNFLKNKTIPTSKRDKHQKIKSLLWDEDVNKMILKYLWSKGCAVTIKDFKTYVEESVFPAIGIEQKKTISENTARIWLNKLGWFFQVGKKNIYYDGHERPDVIAYRENFLLEMESLEKLMPKPMDEDITVMIEPQLNPNEKKHILVTHDESVFYANDGKKTYWGPKNHAPLRKKGNGLSLHISDFLTEIDGRLKFEDKEACI